MTGKPGRKNAVPSVRLRIVFGGNGMLGPGKADLLDRIREEGSISAAGRKMGMSYKRAWTLVETLNGIFAEPLVEMNRGGARGGGARLTVTGETVLALYREVEAEAVKAGAKQIRKLNAMLRDTANAK